jgi:hypothetical protein
MEPFVLYLHDSHILSFEIETVLQIDPEVAELLTPTLQHVGWLVLPNPTKICRPFILVCRSLDDSMVLVCSAQSD